MDLTMFDFDGLSFTGGAKHLILSENPQVILCGPWVSGKSFALTSKAHLLCKNYPGVTVGLVGLDKESIRFSIRLLYEQVIKKSDTDIDDLAIYGGKKIRHVDYPNGSRIMFLTKDGILASECDYISMFSVEGLELDEWEMLYTRIIRGTGIMPYTQVAGDFTWKFNNNDFRSYKKSHWIWDNNNVHLITQSYYNNPLIYDMQRNQFTEYGKEVKNMYLSSGLWRYEHAPN